MPRPALHPSPFTLRRALTVVRVGGVHDRLSAGPGPLLEPRVVHAPWAAALAVTRRRRRVVAARHRLRRSRPGESRLETPQWLVLPVNTTRHKSRVSRVSVRVC